MNTTVIEPDEMPVDPKMPHGDMLLEIFRRISDLSDSLHSTHGVLQVSLKEHNKLADKRHMMQMNVLRKILSEVLEIKASLADVSETVYVHDAKLTLMEHTEIQ